jgi:hypothetical protein
VSGYEGTAPPTGRPGTATYRSGDELATARALSELAHRLVEVASETISRREQRSVHLTG